MLGFDVYKILESNKDIISEIDNMLEDDIDTELEDWGPDLMRSLCLDCAKVLGTDFIAEHVLNTDLRTQISSLQLTKEFTLSALVSQFIADNDSETFIYMLEEVIAENFYNLFEEDVRQLIEDRRAVMNDGMMRVSNDYD